MSARSAVQFYQLRPLIEKPPRGPLHCRIRLRVSAGAGNIAGAGRRCTWQHVVTTPCSLFQDQAFNVELGISLVLPWAAAPAPWFEAPFPCIAGVSWVEIRHSNVTCRKPSWMCTRSSGVVVTVPWPTAGDATRPLPHRALLLSIDCRADSCRCDRCTLSAIARHLLYYLYRHLQFVTYCVPLCTGSSAAAAAHL